MRLTGSAKVKFVRQSSKFRKVIMFLLCNNKQYSAKNV